MKRLTAALAVALTAGCAGRTPVQPLTPDLFRLGAEFDSAFAAPEYARAEWGVVVQSLNTGQVLYRRNADRLFMPASNQKLLTASVALARLGAGYRWLTPVLARGARSGDTLQGDLVVIGRGDPSLSLPFAGGGTADALAALRPWADSVRARGIRVIAGRVVGDASYFPDAIYGLGWMWDDLPDNYSAPIGALQVNDGSAYIDVAPGAPGTPAGTTLRPSAAPLRLFGTITSLPAESSAVARLRYTRALASDSVILGGSVAARVTAEISVPDPTRYFEAALTQALSEAGVSVLRRPVAAAPAADTLFVWRSPPLSEVLPHFLKPSQNQIGEALLRTVGGVATGTASVDSGRAAARATLAGFGIPEDAYVLADGSGLSRYNYLAPEAIARILWAMAHRPDFAVYYDALPVGGVDGTIATRLRGTAAEGNVRAKTGSISNARTLSGYVTTPSGERLLFVLMANHFTVPRRVVERTQDFIVERLANFSRESR